MEFVYTFVAATIGIYVGKFLAAKEFEKGQNELLDEIRGLCNGLLKIKDKGTIMITSLSISKGKGPNRAVATTLFERKDKR